MEMNLSGEVSILRWSHAHEDVCSYLASKMAPQWMIAAVEQWLHPV